MHYLSESHKSIEKSLLILQAFKPRNQEMSVFEMSDRLELHRSTVSRILKVLVAYDFLQQDPQTKKFSLGPAIIDLSQSLNQSLKTDLVQIAKPYVDELRDRLEETVIFETLSGRNWIMAHISEGPRRIRLVAEMGERMPIHIASGGKAFLAFSTQETRDELLDRKLRRLTRNTIMEKEKLQRHFDQIRRKGYAFDRAEYDESIHAVGAPIFNYEHKPIASVVVAGTPQRITGKANSRIVLSLKETARKISERLYQRKEDSLRN
jgi:DNA-binding IclR family transcriptional regulator